MRQRQVTMADVARRAGVHPTTVSLALRNHSSLPPQTRERIQRLATEMGYRPNPLVSALMASRTSKANDGTKASIGFLTAWPTPQGWARSPKYADIYKGIRSRADELGYSVEAFWVQQPGLSPQRLASILQTRAVHGVFAAPLPHDLEIEQSSLATFPWEGFSSVALGYSLHRPELHRVSHDYFHGMQLVMENCLRLGYTRPGLIMQKDSARVVDDLWTASYLVAQRRWRKLARIEPQLYQELNELPDLLPDWIHRKKLDAILCIGPTDVLKALRASGVQVPQDIGLATLDRFTLDEPHAGIYQNSVHSGRAAMDFLVAAINRNERGIPNHAHDLLIQGHWMDGPTLPPRHR